MHPSTVTSPTSNGKAPDSSAAIHPSSFIPHPSRGGGPKTLAGKSQSRLNAITHGASVCEDIFVTTLMPEKKVAFDKLLRSLYRYYQPRTEYERTLTERIAICHFRILRVARHESIAMETSSVDFHPTRSIVPHLDRLSRYDMRIEREITSLNDTLISLQIQRGKNIYKFLERDN